MSGGFFRGTSADQDTRFSNKQAKLMKSQKFPPELENLVDITKVKMDVMRPWIANRVTELLGFEDEVLINFIYGLLDGKVVNGKEIQISLTGFMEKNTGKFMKELWTLLLSAEKNASGVPQQFLDAKEEETRKKKAETDRITQEIQKRKEEAQELEQEKADKMDGKVDNSMRADYDALDTGSRQRQPRDSSTRLSADEKEANGRNGSRRRIRGTPSRSNSGSFSNSRSRSEHRSRSISGSPRNRRSDSAERMHHSPLRRSPTPNRRDSPQLSYSPLRRRTSHYRQRSISPSRRRSPSPIGRRLRRSRSPLRRRSRSPLRRRSRSPLRRRSRTPLRRRSRTPLRRRRSPVRYRSRSPIRRRSRSPIRRRYRSPNRRRSPSPAPVQGRSPSLVRHRSPSLIRRRSPSPVRRRSPSPIRRRSPSPLRRRYRRSPSSPRPMSPSRIHRRPPIPSRRRSPTPPGSRSSSPQNLSPQSPVCQAPDSRDRRSPKHQSSPEEPPRNRIRTQEQSSPVHQTTRREINARSPETRTENTLERRTLISSERSPLRDQNDRNSLHQGVPSLSPSPHNSLSGSESPPPSRMKSLGRDRRAISPQESPRREPVIDDIKPSPQWKPKVHKAIPVSQEVEKALIFSEADDPKSKSSGKKLMHSSTTEELKVSAQKANYNVKGGVRLESETLNRKSRMAEERNSRSSDDSDYGASDEHRAEDGEKRKHKRSKRQESDDDHSSDSQLEGKKEAKRRRKEEKKLRKEERRRRRVERRCRKDERRAEKLKLKAVVTVSPPSDPEENHQGYSSDGARAARRDSRSIDDEEESVQKKLEIALREKALESLRAKKGAGH